MNDIVTNLRAGRATDDQLRFVESLIASQSCAELQPYLVAYLKFSKAPRLDDVVELALSCDDAYVVSETIKCLAYRRYDSGPYRKLIWRGVSWPYEDPGHDVTRAALHRLPKYFAATPEVKAALRKHIKSSDPILRDVVGEVVQEYIGVPEASTVRSMGDGKVAEGLSDRARRWLGSD